LQCRIDTSFGRCIVGHHRQRPCVRRRWLRVRSRSRLRSSACGAVMTSANEYREFALECIRTAKKAQNENHREILLDMARQWMNSAVEAERSTALLNEDTPPLVPKDK